MMVVIGPVDYGETCNDGGGDGGHADHGSNDDDGGGDSHQAC